MPRIPYGFTQPEEAPVLNWRLPDVSLSPTLYGTVCRAVASKGGGPGVKSHHRWWRRWAQPSNTYIRQHLPYGKPRGYQHREAHGGNAQKGYRSSSAYNRRLTKWKSSRTQNRRDLRQWKSSLKDIALRLHGGQNPMPPIHPEPTYIERLVMLAKTTALSNRRIHVHTNRSVTNRCTVPIPTDTDVSKKIWSWNIEGLRESAKYDSILSFCKSKNVSLLCAQKTKSESSYYLTKMDVKSSCGDSQPTNTMEWDSSFLPGLDPMFLILSPTPQELLKSISILCLIKLQASMFLPLV